MCDTYRVDVGGKQVYCENVAELRAALPGAVFVDTGLEDDGDFCLCCVDDEATEKATGMSIRRATDDEGWPWPTCIIEPPTTEGGQ